jgi:Zn-dependent oligopeptidase
MEKSLFETFIEMFKKGGGIHINPKNKGKFTASAKRAGMCVQEFARHVLANKDKYSTLQIKRAAFAKGIGGSQKKKK